MDSITTTNNNNETGKSPPGTLESFDAPKFKYQPLEDNLDMGNFQKFFQAEEESKIGFRSSPRPEITKSSKGVFKDKVFFARQFLTDLIFVGIVVIIVIQMGILGTWIYLYNIFSTSIMRTFAWRALLSPFGSVPERKLCDGCSSTGSVEVGHSPPYIPVLGFFLTVLQVIITATFGSFQRCRPTFLFYMKQLLFVEALFVIFAAALSSSLLFNNLQKLENFMQEEILPRTHNEPTLNSSVDGQNKPIGIIWVETQIKNQCCGILGWSDWTNVTANVPASCCFLNECNGSNIYPRGCYTLEYNSVLYYGSLLLIIIISTFTTAVFEYVLCRWYHQRKKETEAMLKATGRRVFMRQGSNFITFGGENINYHIIRKDGVMIETKGALAASTAVNDHHISLEVLDFFPADSISVTRESDRIVLSVVNKEESLEKGTAIITCMDDRNLEKIVVTPTANGIINLYT
ncbi:unnamed protein product [Allacma fusca]|uniref:Tetraspanin n=1 Tax=Allacma fusca TaxID=39272 RepID=A0A8J2LKS5_9HEXA|nr:unnamed protein product [Allacma fusca]